MALATPGPLKDLCSLIFCNHALKLHDKPVFGRVLRRCLDETAFNTVARKFLNDKNLIGIFSAETVR